MTSSNVELKIILLGDEDVGKTSLGRTITEGLFPPADSLRRDESNQCQIYKCNKETIITADNILYNLHLHDPVTEDSLRETISQVDLCYICFDVSSPASFNRVKLKWLPYTAKGRRNMKSILVGLKQDLAQDKGTHQLLSSQGLQPITSEMGKLLANEIQALCYVEVSSLKYLGIEELKEKTVFEWERFKSSGDQDEEKKRRCLLM